MKITSSSSSSNKMLDTLVDKIYNLFFGWIDSLFDDSYYEKEESTIPKSKAEKPKHPPIDEDGKPVEPDAEVEVTDDVKVIHFLPKEIENQEPKDEFTIEITPATLNGADVLMVKVINNTTGKESTTRIAPVNDDKQLKTTVENCRKEVSASCKIGLKKTVTASKSTIQLTNISSSYDMTEAINDIAEVINNEEFQAALPEGDSVYRIDVDNDGYEVDAVEDFKFQSSLYSSTLDCCVKTYMRVQELLWFAKGIDYDNFKSICDSLTYHTQCSTTELAKLCIIHGDAPTFLAMSSDADCTIDKWQALKDCITGYIAMLEGLALIATPDEKMMIESWIRNFNDIIQYQWRCLKPADTLPCPTVSF